MRADRYPLVQGTAEQLPFTPGSFDVVFCDHGVLSWTPPHLPVPQAARAVRHGGGLVFTVTSLGSRPESMLRPSRVVAVKRDPFPVPLPDLEHHLHRAHAQLTGYSRCAAMPLQQPTVRLPSAAGVAEKIPISSGRAAGGRMG